MSGLILHRLLFRETFVSNPRKFEAIFRGHFGARLCITSARRWTASRSRGPARRFAAHPRRTRRRMCARSAGALPDVLACMDVDLVISGAPHFQKVRGRWSQPADRASLSPSIQFVRRLAPCGLCAARARSTPTHSHRSSGTNRRFFDG